jgi:anti-anti-sigma regulatory factor
VSVVSVEGPLESGSSQRLENVLAEPTPSPSKQIVVDLTEAILYDVSPLLLLADQAQRFGSRGRVVVVSGANPTVEPFVGDPSLAGVEWFESLDQAMLELLGDMAKLADWPPDHA